MAKKTPRSNGFSRKLSARSTAPATPAAAKPIQLEIYDTTLRDGAQAEDVSFSADDKVEIARRLKSHLEAMRNDPRLYAHSKEFGAGISTSSLMFRLIVRNIARANRYAFLTGYKSNGQLYIDSAAATPSYE